MSSLIFRRVLMTLGAVLFSLSPVAVFAATINVPADQPTIQAAINAAAAGDTIKVFPGSYQETAPGSTLTAGNGGGTYTFGLFFPDSKPGLTVEGVDAGGNPITSAAGVLADITTVGDADFGPDGIMVEGANVTLQGVKINGNLDPTSLTESDNKTIEVIGDNFTLRYSTTNVPNGGGSVYIDDFSAGGTVVKAYHILDNVFHDGTSVDIASGAGNTGPASGREILRNDWDLQNNGFNGISFNGQGGVAWFVNPVGGAVIKNNSFKNSTQYIRQRGVVTDQTQFDWKSYWTDNTFDKAAIALVTETPFNVQSYSYSTFTNVRRIGSVIQNEIKDTDGVDHAVAGDTLLVKAGTYPENVAVDRSLTIKGAQAGVDARTRVGSESIVNGGASATFTVTADNTTIDGFTLGGPVSSGTAALVMQTGNVGETIQNNIFNNPGRAASITTSNTKFLKNKVVNVFATATDGFQANSTPLSNLTISNNSFSGANGNIYNADITVIEGSSTVVISGNSATGDGTLIALFKTNGAQITNNTVVGDGASSAIYIGGANSHVTVSGNDVSTAGSAVNVANDFGDGVNSSVSITLNKLHDSANGVKIGATAIAIASDVVANRNQLTTESSFGINNLSSLAVDGTCNWWGSASGPGPVGPGSGSLVTANVTYSPWLSTSDLVTSPCTGGQSGSVKITKTANGGNGIFNFTSDIPGHATFSITTAAGTGNVTFSGIPVGGYSVTEVASSTWTMNSNTCSSVTVTNGQTTSCTVTNTKKPTGTASISGVKFEDVNGDGRVNDCPKLKGWTIYIDTNKNGQLDSGEPSAVTDKNGAYSFTNLPAGTYVVREVMQAGWVQTYPGTGSYSVTVTSTQKVTGKDFGNFKLGSISGMKFEDKNGNGKKDAGEGGLSGWTIQLKKGKTLVASTVTDGSGNYSFSNLTVGTYSLSEVMKSGWVQKVAPKDVKVSSGTNSTNNNFGNKKK